MARFDLNQDLAPCEAKEAGPAKRGRAGLPDRQLVLLRHRFI